MTTPNEAPRRQKSLVKLITDLPGLVVDLVKAEIAHLKAELAGKLKNVAFGAAFFVVAAAVAFFLLGVLIAAAVLAFATIMPGWAAALVVAAILLVIIAALVLVGVMSLKRGMPATPNDTIDSVKDDIDVVTNAGK